MHHVISIFVYKRPQFNMKHILVFILLFLSLFYFGQDKQLAGEDKQNVENIIRAFGTNDISKISKLLVYPIEREYPIPPIKNESAFIKNFNHIFDEALVNDIKKSTLDDWQQVGWRGVSFKNGVLWINSEGKIIRINYQSQFEKNQHQQLINQEKKNIYPSLKVFKNAVYKIKIHSYTIRIDELDNGNYRYASWKRNKSEDSKPDLVLNNGVLKFEGSGGNHTITFKNKLFTYTIYRNVLGTSETPEINLIVEKNGRRILSEDGTLINE